MPTYDYKCVEHGYFEQVRRVADYAEGECPTCGEKCPQVVRSAPCLDIEAMSRAGMPGAWETVGDRLTRKHRKVSQHHRVVVGDHED